ncbi:hypothetical protein LIER_08468 [Lithospermum erythrorhizon]|uniref:Uncharacterized protein n=1 Tax=Lithospermum erythrorhizon TaxID=34254 RepID=A0AAV3PEW1_LITER
MPGIDSDLALHRLNADTFKSIKQKKRTFSDQKNLAIQHEIKELHARRTTTHYRVWEHWSTEALNTNSSTSWMPPKDIIKYSSMTTIKKKLLSLWSMGCTVGE